MQNEDGQRSGVDRLEALWVGSNLGWNEGIERVAVSGSTWRWRRCETVREAIEDIEKCARVDLIVAAAQQTEDALRVAALLARHMRFVGAQRTVLLAVAACSVLESSEVAASLPEGVDDLLPASSPDLFRWTLVRAFHKAELDRKHAEANRVRDRVLRAYTVLAECNQALIRSADPLGFLQAVCDLIVEQAGYELAWIGRKDTLPERVVTPVCVAGNDAGYVEQTEIRWDESPRGRGPTGTAIREERLAVLRDTSQAPEYEPWREAALARGYRSSIALPIRCGDAVWGALNIYAAEPDAFGSDERRLLLELAADLGFGLESLQTRRAHEAQTRLLRAIFEHLPGGALLWRRSPTGHWVLRDHNDDACIFGDSPRDIERGKAPQEVLGRFRSLSAWLDRCRNCTEPYVEHLVFGARAGEREQHVMATVSSVDEDHVLLLLQDVSAERLRERQRVQIERFEALGRLAGGVAHDFNNLLTAAFSYLSFAREKLPGDHAAVADLEGLERTMERCANLTRQLLSFGRTQLSKPVAFELDGLVLELLDVLEELLGEETEVVVRNGASGFGVLADPVQVEQVVLNLVVNARDAMGGAGRVTIATKPFELGEHDRARRVFGRTGRFVMLSVADCGRGMDEETRRRMFDPFFTRKGAEQGVGLGLATVYGIVGRSGGDIQVESAPGMGTTIRVYFPRTDRSLERLDTDARRSRLSRAEPKSAERRCVLLVEDNCAVRDVTRRILEQAGYEVLVAGGAAAALELAERNAHAISLVLTDVVMPVMSGPELVERLRAGGLERPVLYMSGYTDRALERQGQTEALLRLLNKPFSQQELLDAVRAAIGAPR